MRSTPALLVLGLILPGSASPTRETPALTIPDHSTEAVMPERATGTFEVKVVPITTTDSMDTGGFGRLALDKTFSGDLTATSKGQMLASGGGQEGSGAYVALERVTGTLKGRTGSFALMHNGTMTPTAMEMRIVVVPGSGTGELSGIAGTFTIIIEGKKHSWVFDYTVGE